MLLTPEQVLEQLPPREYWFTSEIAEVFGVERRTVQYAASRKQIGMKVRQGPRGTYVFQKHDLESLCKHIHGEVGNPQAIARKRERNKKMSEQLATQMIAGKIGPQPDRKVAA